MSKARGHSLASQDPSGSIIAKIIAWSAQNRLIVLILTFALTAAGWLSLQHTAIDAIPDLTDKQVIIRTEFPGQSPQIVEDLVTYPLSAQLLGLPKTKDIRGQSMFGSSFITVIFDDDVDLYWARARVSEALSNLDNRLPLGANPQIGPDATGVGWIYQYALIDTTGQTDLAQLRSLQDWFVKYELAGIKGVAQVASVGGFVREYQILIDPNKLRAYNITMAQLIDAVKAAGQEVGGRVLEQSEQEYIIRSAGYVTAQSDLESLMLRAENGTPVLLSNIARIVQGPALRRGVTEFNGDGEVVAGIIIMRDGENALEVIKRVKTRLSALQNSLPKGVEIIMLYDRAPLITGAIDYLRNKLIQEALIVALIVFLFLMHIRAALIAVISLPLGILGAFIIIKFQGVTANIMSLGGIAIAIGAMIDAAIVLVENTTRRLSEAQNDSDKAVKINNTARIEIIIKACQEVGPGLFFSLLIILVSFLPVFVLTGQSYRLFAPLAFTKSYVMGLGAIIAITVIPVLLVIFLRGSIRPERANPINRITIALYRPILSMALKFKWLCLGLTLLLFSSAIIPMKKLGTEFMPALYEGQLLYMPTTLPGVSLTKMREILGQTNRIIKTVPEVESVFGKAGRSDSATDPAPITMIESWIRLKPQEQWRANITPQDIIDELNARLDMPGLINSWGYPIKIRMDMVSTGIRTPLGIKITGDDLAQIETLAQSIEAIISDIPGTRSAFADRVLGGKYLQITPDRLELARRGIDMAQFQTIIQTALGGMSLSQSFEGRARYDIILRYDRPFRENIDDIKAILVPMRNGAHIPLGEVASLDYAEGPPMIRSENARLTGWVFIDISGRDLGSYVKEAQEKITQDIILPAGYALAWSGQYQQLEQARARLYIAILATILLIFLLLLIHFGRLDRSIMIMLSLPFGLIGGLWAVYWAGYNLSIAVAIGFIALAGIAVETAIIMLLYIDQSVRDNSVQSRQDLKMAIMQGAVLRLRPKLMTMITIIAGLAPIFLSNGLGADVMRRIALPMLGGMISAALLTLIIIPVIYYIWVGRKMS